MEPPATQSIETSAKNFQVEEDEQDKVVNKGMCPFSHFFFKGFVIYSCLILFLFLFFPFLGVIGGAVVLAAMTGQRAALITYAFTTFVRII